MTISIGGNDAGFSNVIINCALYYFTCGSAISEADEFIAKKLPALLETTYKDIRAKATKAEVIVLGYPKLFTKEGKTCNVNFLTSGNEKKMNEGAEKLDAVIKARAEAAGFKFVNPTSAFEAHEVCASEEWLNGQSLPLGKATTRTSKGRKSSRSSSRPRSSARNPPAGALRPRGLGPEHGEVIPRRNSPLLGHSKSSAPGAARRIRECGPEQ